MLVKYDKSQVKALFFDLKDLNSIIGYVTAFTPACSTNRFDKRVAMWALPYFVLEALVSVLNSLYTQKIASPRAAHLCVIRNHDLKTCSNNFRCSSTICIEHLPQIEQSLSMTLQF